jgi:hypothetical protein
MDTDEFDHGLGLAECEQLDSAKGEPSTFYSTDEKKPRGIARRCDLVALRIECTTAFPPWSLIDVSILTFGSTLIHLTEWHCPDAFGSGQTPVD